MHSWLLQSLILGGSDTSTTTLTWTLALLLNNKQTLKKAQDELDLHVGRERQVEESDMKNLVYLQAIVKESLRLYPPAQLLPPRETTEDCNVGGYEWKLSFKFQVLREKLCLFYIERVLNEELCLIQMNSKTKGCLW